MDSRFSLYKTKVWAFAFIIAFITICVYLPALKNDFVNWDDPSHVCENPYIKSLDLESFKWMFSFQLSNWIPFTWLSHAIDYAIWGLNPMGHHLTSIIFHGLNTFLVIILITRLINYANSPLPPFTKHTPFPSQDGIKGCVHSREEHTPIIAGAITGLLFGLHPIHVEPVVWVTARGDVLYTSFFLLSIMSYLKYNSSQKQELTGHSSLVTRHRWYSLCLLFFILSLMSKPMAVTLPLVLLILDLYPLERRGIKVLTEKIPFLGLSIASSAITIMAKQSMDAIVPLRLHTLEDRFLIAIKAFCFYLFKMVWPTQLAPLYPYPLKIYFLSIEHMGTFIFVASITALCIWSWKRQKVFSAIWAYYVITLLPVSGIIQVGEQAAADRYTYLPSLGPFFVIGLGTSWIYNRYNVKKYISTIFSLSLLFIACLLSFMTIKQIKIWKNSILLWNYEIQRFHNNITAYINRGTAHEALGNHQQAIEDYDMAIKIESKAADAYYNRGISYGSLGNYQQAITDFTSAIELNPRYSIAYNNRGVFYGISGNYRKSIEDFNTAIKLQPLYAEAYYNRGISYKNIGSHQQAIKDFTVTIQLNSQHVKAYKSRAHIYSEISDYQNSIKDHQFAARLGDKEAQDYLKSKGIGW